jgi:2-C-methyl-D-erythritol 2,4-cyclodiphosphate synthase
MFTRCGTCAIFTQGSNIDFNHTGVRMTDNHFRTGIGFDFHRLVEGRDLILGGVNIPYEKGLLGHSDADVLVHAICDALLGACGLGDIGIHFPDTDPAYKGISSLELLGKTCALIDANGYRIVNVDAVVLAEAPKIMPHRREMLSRIMQAMVMAPPQALNLKATTTEGCGMVGRGDGIGAMATALIERRPLDRDGGP